MQRLDSCDKAVVISSMPQIRKQVRSRAKSAVRGDPSGAAQMFRTGEHVAPEIRASDAKKKKQI
jgi:hypothetical protein